MTPLQYFDKFPYACEGARKFCYRFKTMREAWDSPDVEPAWMVWALRRCPEHDREMCAAAWESGLVRFSPACSFDLYTVARYWGADRSRELLRARFPTMFKEST